MPNAGVSEEATPSRLDTVARWRSAIESVLPISCYAPDENDIRHERQMDGIAKARERGVRFGRKRELTPKRIDEIRALREAGTTVPDIIRQTGLSKASVYRALS